MRSTVESACAVSLRMDTQRRQTQLSSTKANYKDKFVENHFCPLDTYLQTHASGVSFPSKRAKVAYVSNVLRKTVHRDDDGDLGIEISVLPPGVKHTVRRGVN